MEQRGRLNAFEEWEVEELLGKKREAERKELLHGRILRQKKNKTEFLGRIRNNKRHSYNYSAHPLVQPLIQPVEPPPEEETAPHTPAPSNRLL